MLASRNRSKTDRKSTRLNSTLSLHDALPISMLTDVSGGIEIQRVKYWCINASRRLVWPNASQPEPIKDRSEEHTSELHSFPTRRSSDLDANRRLRRH